MNNITRACEYVPYTPSSPVCLFLVLCFLFMLFFIYFDTGRALQEATYLTLGQRVFSALQEPTQMVRQVAYPPSTLT